MFLHSGPYPCGIGSIDMDAMLHQVYINFQHTCQGSANCLSLLSYTLAASCTVTQSLLSTIAMSKWKCIANVGITCDICYLKYLPCDCVLCFTMHL